MPNEKDTNTEITTTEHTADFEPAAWALWVDKLGKNKNIALREWRTTPETRKWLLTKATLGAGTVAAAIGHLLNELPF